MVQYNTNNRLAPLTVPLGPWPFDIGQKRVTDETAAVDGHGARSSGADHAERHRPEGLRGVGAGARSLLRREVGQPLRDAAVDARSRGAPAGGSLLWARHGKGTFVYTGLAFFRQLPAGVPGAYRLFANLLAGGHARAP